jgi:hypothetical protein
MNYATQTKNIKYPTATITVGRFIISYQWHPSAAFCGTAWGWESHEPDGFDDTPEERHLETLERSISHLSDECFMDELIAALERTPFDMGNVGELQ